MEGGARTLPVESVTAAAYTIPTDQPESDGTLEWDSTTLVLARATAGGETGLGYSYTHAAAARVIDDDLAALVRGMDAFEVGACWDAMKAAVRNIGACGIAASAYSAVDTALWDLKARLLDVSLATLLGGRIDAAPLYGSGGFTSMTVDQLRSQLAAWVHDLGIPQVKMKVGRHPEHDATRVREARDAIGPAANLFVDANGAYRLKQALAMADRFAAEQVVWFEEPVSSDDREGLRLLRDRAPGDMDIAAGEYAWTVFHFRDLIEAGAIDVAQPDATRCGGYTGFLRAAALCDAYGIPISAHTAPQLHAHVCVAAPGVRHMEYYWDHDRIERIFFDGALDPHDGALRPDRARPGNGLTLKTRDTERYRVH